ncbi:protein prune homolog 2-like isoform X5 [Portunus trituberculatus]|uniref:protein prune homolog 2-like isoform X5 n=1 Tax=Portunus trituberculatus TaxID=210409 RepID=UPI001E1CD5AD|nr:protein prune homolog 2-like isoform X5 [Portunus trituberculatus]
MNEISAGEGVPDPASEESMDVSEASNSSGTLANHSPLSDNIYSYEQGVRDPLRFPMQQNGRLVGAALERDLSSASGAGQAAAAPAGGQKPAPFNLSHLEYTLPDTEIYEPETVDFPNSPTALRYMVDPSEECGGVRLAEREDTSQPPATPTEEDRSLYTAVVSPPTGQVTLRKGLGPQPRIDPLPEYTTSQEASEERSWRSVVISGIERRIDMKVIEPYKKVLSHGGYLLGSSEAIIVFSACFLPDRSRKDYDYVMDNLFMYVLTTLDQLIAEDYILIYLHGATTRGNMPSFAWLKRCYQMIDRRLRKNLQGLYLVHPTFWVKTVVVMTRPFVSAKFTRKLRFVNSLKELSSLIPMDQVCIPDRVKQYDEIRESLLVKA